MTVPTLIVEVAFDDGPYVASPTWTDITQYVLSATTRRGRSSDFDDTFTSSATLVLNNNTRIFDPFNNAGTYYNKLTPRRQIRIRGTANGTTYGIFRGFINGFPVVWSGAGKESTVTISAFDILALSSTDLLNGDLAGVYTQSLSPVHYYRCSDPNGSNTVVDYGSAGDNLSVSTDPVYADRRFTSSPSLGIGLLGSSASFENTSYTKDITANNPSTGDVTVSLWTKPHIYNLGGIGLYNTSPSFISELSMGVSSSTSSSNGVAGFGTIKAAGGGSLQQATMQFSGAFNESIPVHLVGTYNSSTGVHKLYINGVDSGTLVGGSFYTGLRMLPLQRFDVFNSTFQDIAIFGSLLTATQISNIYNFGAGSQSEDTHLRLDRILDLTNIPAGLQSIYTTSYGVIFGVPKPNTKIVDALMEVMRTEGGFLFVNKDGVLTAVNREYFKNNAKSVTSQATIDDTGSNIPYSNQVSMWYDGDNIRNEITVEYGNGAQTTVSDSTSISNYGKHTNNIRTQSSTAAEATELAQHYLDYFSPLFPSVSTIEIGTNVTAAQWSTLLGLELLERITFKRTPATGTAFQQDLSINSVELDMRPTNWVMKLNGTARYAPSAPTVATASATSITDTTATLNGTVSANYFSTTGIKFQYSTASNFATYTEVNATPSSTSGQNVSVSANITGLTFATQYYYRLIATSTVGTSTSTSGTFTSLASVPTASTSSATNITGDSATLNGTVSANGASTVVKFQYSQDVGFGAGQVTEVTATQSPVSGQSVSVSADITGLMFTAEYYFRIVAINSAGTTTSSATMFTTTALPPTGFAPTASSITGTTAQLNGLVSPRGAITSLYFQWGTSSTLATYTQVAGSPTTTSNTFSGQSFFATLSGLNYNTTYYYRVYATNSAGNFTSSIESLQTLVGVPTASTSPATNITTTSATLNGSVSSNGASTTVKFQYSTASNFSTYTEVNAAQSPVSGSGVSVSANITGLSIGTYYFRIVATNSAGTTTTLGESFLVAIAPTVTMSSTTQFNQERATFNGTVSANGATTTTIKFQISTDNSNWSDATGGTAISNTSSDNVSVSYNATGLSANTLYYVRLVATNAKGTTNSTSNSFTTWSLKTFTQTTAGSFSVQIPSITGVAPVIYEMILYGAGGGANYGGGGGGGYRLFSSHTSSTTGTQTISGSVGAGGAAGNGGTGTGTATTGGSTTLTIGSTTWTGGGGTAGEHPGQNSNPYGRGGTAGSGTNTSHLGGTNTYGYYYFTGNYVCVASDKFGNCTAYDYNQPIYAWDAGYYACGGGGGTEFQGGNAYTQGSASHNGGNGGNGGGAYGLRGGNGGGGYGTQSSGVAGLFNPSLTGTIVGTGGSHFSAGLAGGITFKYYGP